MAQVQSKVKVTLTVFSDHKGIVHYEYAPGHTVNKKYYVKFSVGCVMRCSASELCYESNMTQQHNIPIHLSDHVQNVLAKLQIPHVLQPLFTGHGPM
jgi:hypothetical protein